MDLRKITTKNMNNTILAGFTIVIFLFLTFLLPGRFLTLRNFQSMGSQIPEFGLLALAMMIAMLTGGIDLSVVAIANLSGIITAMIMKNFVTPEMGAGGSFFIVLAAITAGLVVSVLCGMINGFLISRVGMSSIIATLGTMALFEGIGIIITSSRGIVGFPDEFVFLGNGFLWIFPMPFVIFAVTVAIFSVIVNKTMLGRRIKMLGANPVAARFSGINITNVLSRVYVITGLLAGVSAMIMISRSNSAKSGYGSSYLLQSILIAVLGGVNPAGGFGTVTGVMMGILILQFLSSGFNILAFSPFAQNIIRGSMLLIIMIINHLSNQRGMKKIKHKKASTVNG